MGENPRGIEHYTFGVCLLVIAEYALKTKADKTDLVATKIDTHIDVLDVDKDPRADSIPVECCRIRPYAGQGEDSAQSEGYLAAVTAYVTRSIAPPP